MVRVLVQRHGHLLRGIQHVQLVLRDLLHGSHLRAVFLERRPRGRHPLLELRQNNLHAFLAVHPLADRADLAEEAHRAADHGDVALPVRADGVHGDGEEVSVGACGGADADLAFVVLGDLDGERLAGEFAEDDGDGVEGLDRGLGVVGARGEGAERDVGQLLDAEGDVDLARALDVNDHGLVDVLSQCGLCGLEFVAGAEARELVPVVFHAEVEAVLCDAPALLFLGALGELRALFLGDFAAPDPGDDGALGDELTDVRRESDDEV
mmetsp:Transcript_15745/g.40442  ORF Transcript_15745/g.40442 Transcript_15745/m.40442 type:complete len:266 (+) Transcript_15745:632-1429(+)